MYALHNDLIERTIKIEHMACITYASSATSTQPIIVLFLMVLR